MMYMIWENWLDGLLQNSKNTMSIFEGKMSGWGWYPQVIKLLFFQYYNIYLQRRAAVGQ